MKRILLTALIASMACVSVDAQIVPVGRYRHASTAAEGRLSGLGDLYHGQGRFLKDKGHYLIDYEHARGLYVDNWKNAVHSRWEIQDEWKARLHRDNPDYVTREHKRLDVLEKRHALELRKKSLMEDGILPKPPESAFFYKGEKFANYNDFKKSPEYKQMLGETAVRTMLRRIDQKGKAQRGVEALRFMATWNKMNYFQREKYLRKRHLEQTLAQPFTGPPKYMVKPMKTQSKPTVPPHHRFPPRLR